MLAQRVAIAAAGIPVIVVLVIVGGWPYGVAVALALAIAAAEFQHLRYSWSAPQTLAAAAFAGAMLLLTQSEGEDAAIWIAGAAGVLLLLSSVADVARMPISADAWWWAALCVLYVALLGSTFVLLRDLDNGRDWTFLALLSTFAVDTAAYFTGRTIGRHKLAPAISPKKTWEGFAGGWAGGAAAALALNAALGLDVRPAVIVPLALLLPLAATAGDLVESWAKRRAGVKDASHLIPGHGGALDRLDSLLFTFPLVWLFARYWA